jgi:CRISPR/Cas system-associated protein Csm6
MTEQKRWSDPQRVLALEAEARYARERYDLYRAKVYGSRQTSPTRLRKLQEESRYAEARLSRARGDRLSRASERHQP